MGLAYTVAVGSFFVGQPRFLPRIMQDNPLVAGLPLAALAVTLFWLLRTRLPRRLREAQPPPVPLPG